MFFYFIIYIFIFKFIKITYKLKYVIYYIFKINIISIYIFFNFYTHIYI